MQFCSIMRKRCESFVKNKLTIVETFTSAISVMTTRRKKMGESESMEGYVISSYGALRSASFGESRLIPNRFINISSAFFCYEKYSFEFNKTTVKLNQF